jgi:magnesium transporter
MPNQINFSKVQELVNSRDVRKLRLELAEYKEVDIAHFIEELSAEKAMITFYTLPKDMAAEVFAHLLPETQKYIIEAITDEELTAIIEDLFVDDVVDLLEELPANMVKRILKSTPPKRRLLINQFLKYPEESAGSIMTAEFTDLRKNMTVEQAIKHIRSTGEDRETIYTCYVLNDERVLEGLVSVRDLLLSEDELIINDIMEKKVG